LENAGHDCNQLSFGDRITSKRKNWLSTFSAAIRWPSAIYDHLGEIQKLQSDLKIARDRMNAPSYAKEVFADIGSPVHEFITY
jgi:hypothetical protein